MPSIPRYLPVQRISAISSPYNCVFVFPHGNRRSKAGRNPVCLPNLRSLALEHCQPEGTLAVGSVVLKAKPPAAAAAAGVADLSMFRGCTELRSIRCDTRRVVCMCRAVRCSTPVCHYLTGLLFSFLAVSTC